MAAAAGRCGTIGLSVPALESGCLDGEMRVAWLDQWFSGKTVLVTGASSGIGRATALEFARSGAQLVLAARRAAALEETATGARELGAKVLVVPTDVTRRVAVRACFRKATQAFGGVDVAVNNAGVLIPARVAETRAADVQRMLDVNLFGAMYVMQEAAAAMHGRGGSIVNVASLGGRRGYSPLGAYCATKFALIGLTEAMRIELHGEPIRLSLVLPGVVDTPMVENASTLPEARDSWPRAFDMPPRWVARTILLAARFNLVEVSVPPGGATLEKIAALAPGATDRLLRWASGGTRRFARRLRTGD